MRARRERAVAHVALLQTAVIQERDGLDGVTTPAYLELFQAAVWFTRPRPWWRFW